MNNSAFQPPEEQKPDLAERAGKLATLIEAAEIVLASREWRTLKEEEFDGYLERNERLLLAEAKRKELDQAEIYRYQGRIEVLKRFSLEQLCEKYRTELEGIRKLNPPGGAG